MRRALILVLCLVCARTASGATVNAVTCAQADVTSAIGSATSGDTVSVPAGNCTWQTSVTLTKAVVIQGAGAGVTNITLASGVKLDLSTFASTSVTGIAFTSSTKTTSEEWILARGQDFRIHHNTFTNTQAGTNNACILSKGGTGIPHPVGLVDHNTFVNCRVYIQGDISNAFGNAEWAEDTDWGASRQVYIEDNTFTFNLTQGNCTDSQYGGRYVARFNTVTGCPFEIHGAINGRASRATEVYDNTWISTGNNAAFATFWRGGATIAFGNSFASGYEAAGDHQSIRIDTTRSGTNHSGTGIFSPQCDGTNAVDGNSIASGNPGAGYLCRDQPGSGKDTSLFVNGSSPYPAQASEPWPIFLNRTCATPPCSTSDAQSVVSLVNGSSPYIVDGRDYQNERSGFDGTIGTGVGLKASRPSTCTTGVYYWATDEGEWNSLHSGADGNLYKCTATDTWTLFYTPYDYPHPLQGAAAGSDPPTVTVNAPADHTNTTGSTIAFNGSSADDVSVSGTTTANDQGGSCGNGGSATAWSVASCALTDQAVNTLSASAVDGDSQQTVATVRVYRHTAPATPADSFPANGGWPDLGPLWTTVVTSTALAINSSQQAYSSDGNFAASTYTGSSFANDQFFEIALKATPNVTDVAHVGVRVSGSDATINGYFCAAQSGLIVAYKFVNGTQTALVAAAATWGVVDTLRASVTGTTFTCLHNGVQATSVTDSSLSSGKGAIAVQGAMVVDDAVGGDVSAGSDTTGPHVTITTPTTSTQGLTWLPSVAIGGTVHDEAGGSGVSSCSYASDRGASGSLVVLAGAFSGTVPLSEGNNAITVTCLDVAGNRGTDEIAIYKDVPAGRLGRQFPRRIGG